VPPTVIAEPAFFASLKDAPQHEIANVALGKMSGWKCQPFTLSSSAREGKMRPDVALPQALPLGRS